VFEKRATISDKTGVEFPIRLMCLIYAVFSAESTVNKCHGYCSVFGFVSLNGYCPGSQNNLPLMDQESEPHSDEVSNRLD
tara:strand:+ start:1712 stop:1951 length:240 start_codon:yes stop_codon:yes gene_type:complete